MADKMSVEMNIADNNSENLIETFRQIVRIYYERNMYESAEYVADKLVRLSDDPQDVYLHAQCLFHLRQYRRVAHVITSRDIHKSLPSCHYLAARSLVEAKEYAEAMKILEEEECPSSALSPTYNQSLLNSTLAVPTEMCNLESAKMLLKAKILQANKNRGRAADCYRAALQLDVRCHEAFNALIQYQMLSAAQEEELLESLPFKEQCSPQEAKIWKSLYLDQMKKYAQPIRVAENSIHSTANKGEKKPVDMDVALYKISDSLDSKTWFAERLYFNCDYHQCLEITTEIHKKDPFYLGCLTVHFGCLVNFKKYNELFMLGHKFVRYYPEVAVSWYAVGCYYYVIEKHDEARKYLSKSTTVDELFGPAWLAHGHSFAAENEHDQAMASYFRASQLMKGCHLPLLYVGIECGRTNNTKLAEKFFNQALEIAPNDPYVMHEMGVIAFQKENFIEAKNHYTSALERIKSVGSRRLEEEWEPLLNNLGHVCRKLGEYEEALMYHQQALTLKPLTASTYSAMGLVYMLLGNMDEAVTSFHEALSLRPDDTFSTTMLGQAMDCLATSSPDGEGHPFSGEGVELPELPAETTGPTPSGTATQAPPSGGVVTIDDSQLSIAECDMEDAFTP